MADTDEQIGILRLLGISLKDLQPFRDEDSDVTQLALPASGDEEEDTANSSPIVLKQDENAFQLTSSSPKKMSYNQFFNTLDRGFNYVPTLGQTHSLAISSVVTIINTAVQSKFFGFDLTTREGLYDLLLWSAPTTDFKKYYNHEEFLSTRKSIIEENFYTILSKRLPRRMMKSDLTMYDALHNKMAIEIKEAKDIEWYINCLLLAMTVFKTVMWLSLLSSARKGTLLSDFRRINGSLSYMHVASSVTSGVVTLMASNGITVGLLAGGFSKYFDYSSEVLKNANLPVLATRIEEFKKIALSAGVASAVSMFVNKYLKKTIATGLTVVPVIGPAASGLLGEMYSSVGSGPISEMDVVEEVVKSLTEFLEEEHDEEALILETIAYLKDHYSTQASIEELELILKLNIQRYQADGRVHYYIAERRSERAEALLDELNEWNTLGKNKDGNYYSRIEEKTLNANKRGYQKYTTGRSGLQWCVDQGHLLKEMTKLPNTALSYTTQKNIKFKCDLNKFMPRKKVQEKDKYGDVREYFKKYGNQMNAIWTAWQKRWDRMKAWDENGRETTWHSGHDGGDFAWFVVVGEDGEDEAIVPVLRHDPFKTNVMRDKKETKKILGGRREVTTDHTPDTHMRDLRTSPESIYKIVD